MVDEAEFETVGTLYEAALAPEAWGTALSRLARHVGGTLANMAMVDFRYPECRLNAASDWWTPEAVADYERNVAPDEVQYWQALQGFQPQSVVCDTEYFTDRRVYDSLPMVRWTRYWRSAIWSS